MENEKDVKLFASGDENPTVEQSVDIDSLKREMLNGNIGKSRELGRRLAQSFSRAAEKDQINNIASSCGIDFLTRETKDQAILLCVFTAEFCLTNFIEQSASSIEAIAGLYAGLLEDSPELYNKLLSSSAFSFYYLNVNKNEESKIDIKAVGKTFAMLCGNTSSATLSHLGENLFASCFDDYMRMIGEVVFS